MHSRNAKVCIELDDNSFQWYLDKNEGNEERAWGSVAMDMSLSGGTAIHGNVRFGEYDEVLDAGYVCDGCGDAIGDHREATFTLENYGWHHNSCLSWAELNE